MCRRVTQPKRILPFLAASLILGVACIADPGLVRDGDRFLLLLTFLWVLTLCLAIVYCRVRGLWLLIGLPLVLYYWFIPAYPIVN